MTTRTDGVAQTGEAPLTGPLLRFRTAAYVTGFGLLALCFVMVLRYGFGNPTPSAVYSPIHGVLYMIYLVLTIDLAIKARWSIKSTVLVLLAGCVPFVSFLVERRVTHRVSAGQNIF
jgi:integral membrane protein